jgi:transposase
LRNHTKTFKAVAEQYNVTAQSVINLFDNHVQPNRLPLTEYICMDEFYTGKSKKHKYALVMMDFERKQIIDIYDTRQKNTVIESLFKISLQERSRVKAVIIDMWDSYKDVINSCFPKAIVAVDSFHVIWHMNEAVKSIRIRISHRFKKEVSNLQANDMYYYMLKKFHFFLIVDYDKLASSYKIPKLNTYYTKDNLLHYLLSIDPELEAAYKLKEAYRYFNKTADYETCEERLDDLITQFKHNKSHEFKHVYKMLLNWKEEIMNSFIRVNQRRLSNGPIENINSQIKTIMKSANGYKEFYRLRNRIFYTLNRDTPIKW